MKTMENHLRNAGLRASVVAVITTLVFLSYFGFRFGLNSPPSASGDEPSYDSLGWSVAHGRGFREDFNDPEFRKLYDDATNSDAALTKLAKHPGGIITYRPPLFPAVIAVTDVLFGRQLWSIRSINTLAICVSGALVYWFLLRNAGASTALVSLILFFVIDVRVRLYARAILTEALAVLLTTLLTILVFNVVRWRHFRDVVLLGIVCGLSILNRTAILLWLPGLACGMLLLGCMHGSHGPVDTESVHDKLNPRKSTRTNGFISMLASVGTAMCIATFIYAPWGIRNCEVLDRFMPMGTQGMMELSAAFSDQAFYRQGVWFNLSDLDFFSAIDDPEMSSLEKELARADYSKAAALNWITENRAKAIMLAPVKIFHEYRPRSTTEWLIAALAILGVAVSGKQLSTQVFLLMHAVNALMIAVTWSVEGRFVVPLLFSIHVLAGTGFNWLWRTLIRPERTQSAAPH